MAIKIFITATNTDVGKTYTTLLLMEAAARRGMAPAALKPIETGVQNNIPADGSALLEATRRLNPAAARLSIGDVVPISFELPAAPYVAKGKQSISLSPIFSALEKLEDMCDILFIEGAGGLMVPIDDGLFMIDLPKLFEADTLLLSPGILGSINDTLLSMEALDRRGIEHTLAINLRSCDEEFERITKPYYTAAGVEYLLLPRQVDTLLEKISS